MYIDLLSKLEKNLCLSFYSQCRQYVLQKLQNCIWRVFPILKSKMAAAYQSHFLFSLNRADLLQVNKMTTFCQSVFLENNEPNRFTLQYVSCDRKEACTRLHPDRVRNWVWRSVGWSLASVQGSWKLANKVMALLGGGGYAEYVMPVPSQLALCQAWLTAHQLLHLISNVTSYMCGWDF